MNGETSPRSVSKEPELSISLRLSKNDGRHGWPATKN